MSLGQFSVPNMPARPAKRYTGAAQGYEIQSPGLARNIGPARSLADAFPSSLRLSGVPLTAWAVSGVVWSQVVGGRTQDRDSPLSTRGCISQGPDSDELRLVVEGLSDHHPTCPTYETATYPFHSQLQQLQVT